MTQTLNPELSDSLTRIAGLLLSEERLDAILELVISLTTRTLPRANGVSVTLVREGKFGTAVYSNEVSKRVDSWQYATREGPCLSAIVEGQTFVACDLREESRWPEFAKMASDEGVLSVLSVPFQPMGESIGCLNTYSTKPEAFNEEDVETASLFAQQAAIVIANSVAYSNQLLTNGQLREALESRETIGQAKGILMAQLGCTPDEAFDRLRHTSQNTNKKLRDVAQAVIDSVERSTDTSE